ncbi:MAG TPA: hypothetical protein VLL75_08665, partial [Vicinamibacteria bacterium]|nr:hypothetical protein [Vicinamibacteria bacterium]
MRASRAFSSGRPAGDGVVRPVERAALAREDCHHQVDRADGDCALLAQRERPDVDLGRQEHADLAPRPLAEHEHGRPQGNAGRVERGVDGALQLARARGGRRAVGGARRVVAPPRPHPHALARHADLDAAETLVVAPGGRRV